MPEPTETRVTGLSDMTESVREAYAGSGEGYDFKRVYHEQMAAFDQWLTDIRNAARREGAEAMRKRAAKEVLDYYPDTLPAQIYVPRDAAAQTIRHLDIPYPDPEADYA